MGQKEVPGPGHPCWACTWRMDSAWGARRDVAWGEEITEHRRLEER